MARLLNTNLLNTEILYREVCMPQNTNENNSIFGGHIAGCFDLAGSYLAAKIIKNSIVSVSVQDFDFIAPLRVGNLMTIYGIVTEVGRSSITIYLEMYGNSLTANSQQQFLAGRSTWKFVSINEQSKPVAINKENNLDLEAALKVTKQILAQEEKND